MKVYGNLINRIQEDIRSADPEVGMGVTEMMYSDRQAYTIVKVLGPKAIEVQRDRAIRTDGHGMSDSQSYRYEPDSAGRVTVVTLRKDGRWREQGVSLNSTGSVWLVGVRDERYDYSF